MSVKFIEVKLQDVMEYFAKAFYNTENKNVSYNMQRYFIDGTKVVFVIDEIEGVDNDE